MSIYNAGVIKRHRKVSSALLVAAAVFSTLPASHANDGPRISEDPLTLDVHFHFRNSLVYNNEWPVEIKAAEHTGITLNNVAPESIKDSAAAFNLMMAAGNLPDIVGGNHLQHKFNQHGPSGTFIPLDALIEAHAPNIKAFFDENPNLKRSVTASDGSLYFIPYLPDGKYGRAYFIRTDWLAKLNLSSPDNTDDLYAVLTAFKKQDHNGNGLADEIPFFARDSQEMVRLVTLWDARTSGSDTAHDFYVENNRIKHGYYQEEYRTGIENLSKWYSEGLIDPEVFSRGGKGRTELLSSNRGGMTHDWFASTATYNTSLSSTVEGFEFKPFAPPASPSGRRIAEHRRNQVKPDGWAITSTNKSPVETIRYFDFWFSEQGKRLANFGIENDHYTLIDGKPVFNSEILYGDIPVNTFLWSVGAQIPRGFPQDYAYEKQWSNQVALDGIALYDEGEYLVDPFLGVALNPDEKEIIDLYWESVLGFMLERQEDWILGYRDVSEDWNSYLSKLDKLGMGKVLETMQSAYERQYGLQVTAEAE